MSENKIDFKGISEAINKRKQEKKEEVKVTRNALMEVLLKHNVKEVVVGFDGSCDSGSIERFEYQAAKEIKGDEIVLGTLKTKTEWCTKKQNFVTSTKESTLNDMVEEVCYDLLEISHGGWEINEGSYGEFLIEPKEDKISLTFNRRFESVETSEEEF
jgi:hypothetical protein